MSKVPRICVSAGIVGAIISCISVIRVNHTILALTLLLLCFNYSFLPPVGTWTITDPQNWVALSAFFCDRGGDERAFGDREEAAREAMHRRHEMERHYQVSLSDARGCAIPLAAHPRWPRTPDSYIDIRRK